MATAQVARGPLTALLQSASGQYIVLGLGVYTLFPDQVRRALGPLLSQYPALAGQLGDFSQGQQQQQQPQQNGMAPIIIQTPSPMIINGNSSVLSNKSLTTVVVYSIAGAGACWVGYIVCSQLLPDAVSEFMPVTKRLFKETSQTLGKGILQVKQILEEQISQLMGQQDLLEKKQDETNTRVQDVQQSLKGARSDLLGLQESLTGMEGSLDETKEMQGYTLRGIKLLVKCVTSFLPDESNFIDDISRYVNDDDVNQQIENGHSSLPPKALPSRPSATPSTESSMMTRHTSLPMQQHHNQPKGMFARASSQGRTTSHSPDTDDTAPIPSVTSSIDSQDDDCSSTTDDNMSANGNFTMGDIRALLGH